MTETSTRKSNGDRRLNVMFGDFCYFNRHTLSNQFTPLNIGLIAQYATQQFGGDVDVSLFKSAEKFLDRAAQKPPDIVGLSVYYWKLDIHFALVMSICWDGEPGIPSRRRGRLPAHPD